MKRRLFQPDQFPVKFNTPLQRLCQYREPRRVWILLNLTVHKKKCFTALIALKKPPNTCKNNYTKTLWKDLSYNCLLTKYGKLPGAMLPLFMK